MKYFLKICKFFFFVGLSSYISFDLFEMTINEFSLDTFDLKFILVFFLILIIDIFCLIQVIYPFEKPEWYKNSFINIKSANKK